MAQVFSNAAETTLAVAVLAGDLVITVDSGGGAKFAAPSGGDVQLGTLKGLNGLEVIAITDVTGDVLTITRAQEGTTALGFSIGEAVFAGVTALVLETLQSDTVSKLTVDNGGDALGADAINVQPSRTATENVASGASSVTLGPDTRASGSKGTAVGASSINRVDGTHTVTGPSMVRGDNGETAADAHLNFVGQENYYFSSLIDLTQAAADDLVTFSVPSVALLFASEVGFILDDVSGVTIQPSISFGVSGASTQLLASTALTKTAAGGNDLFTSLDRDGVPDVTGSLKVAATATSYTGRFYVKGCLLEVSIPLPYGSGYWIGGELGAGYPTTTQGINFSAESLIDVAVTLSVDRTTPAGVSSSLKGYCLGGYNGSTQVTDIDGIQFSDDTAINPAAVLSAVKTGSSGLTSSVRGYAAGGWNGSSRMTSIDGIQFSDDTAINPAAVLSLGRSASHRGSSSTDGYVLGGYDGSSLATIDGIQFSDETAINPAAVLSPVRDDGASTSSAIKAFLAGGYNQLTSMDGFLYSIEARTIISAVLSQGRHYFSGVFSTTEGYYGGGSGNTTLIDGITFAAETAINPSAALTAGLEGTAGVQTS